MPQFPRITHIIYDLDGLLLDTETINHQVNTTLIESYNSAFTPALKAEIAGRTAFDSCKIIVESLSLPISPEDYVEKRNQLLTNLLPHAQLMPGARKLTQHLATCQVPQAIATSSSVFSFELKTRQHLSWLSLFDCIVLGDDEELEHGKPAPDIFLLAAKRLGAIPEQCLVFEDAPAGVEAALAAGMSVVAIPDPSLNLNLKAQQVLTSLTEFSPQDWHLPGF